MESNLNNESSIQTKKQKQQSEQSVDKGRHDQEQRLEIPIYKNGSKKLNQNVIQLNHRYEYPQQENQLYLLRQQVEKLLNRKNLCINTYLYKHMTKPLIFKLDTVSCQRAIRSINHNQPQLIEVINQSGLAKVVGGEVHLIENPTVKILTSQKLKLFEVEKRLKTQKKRYEIAKSSDRDYMNLTLLNGDLKQLQSIMKDYNIEYQATSLYQDIQKGVERINKLKLLQIQNNTLVGKTKYILGQPPHLFIRKAVDTSTSEEEANPTNDQAQNAQIKGVRRRRFERGPFKQQEFPELR